MAVKITVKMAVRVFTTISRRRRFVGAERATELILEYEYPPKYYNTHFCTVTTEVLVIFLALLRNKNSQIINREISKLAITSVREGNQYHSSE